MFRSWAQPKSLFIARHFHHLLRNNIWLLSATWLVLGPRLLLSTMQELLGFCAGVGGATIVLWYLLLFTGSCVRWYVWNCLKVGNSFCQGSGLFIAAYDRTVVVIFSAVAFLYVVCHLWSLCLEHSPFVGCCPEENPQLPPIPRSHVCEEDPKVEEVGAKNIKKYGRSSMVLRCGTDLIHVTHMFQSLSIYVYVNRASIHLVSTCYISGFQIRYSRAFFGLSMAFGCVWTDVHPPKQVRLFRARWSDWITEGCCK